MARVCDVCGKGSAAGNSRSHSMQATKRSFKPNLQKKKITLSSDPENGDFVIEVKMCTKCFKTYRMAT